MVLAMGVMSEFGGIDGMTFPLLFRQNSVIGSCDWRRKTDEDRVGVRVYPPGGRTGLYHVIS